MLKKILLPLDGSLLSERAIPFAAELARRSGAGVCLVEAIRGRADRGGDPRGTRDDEATRRAETTLGAAAAILRADGIAAEAHVLDDDPLPAILGAADRYAADLIVMSTHGRSGLGRMLFGSVADRVLHHAPVPIVLVPPHVELTWPADRPLSVLVPLDGSDFAEEALATIGRLASAADARLTLLRVVEPLPYPIAGDGYAAFPVDMDQEAEIELAGSYLAEQRGRLDADHRQADVQVSRGRASEVIAATADEQGVDLVAMSTHGDGGLTRLLLGSVATAVVQHATVPILLVRPPAARPADANDSGTTAGTGRAPATA